MKKLFEKIDVETFWGGLFGIVAIVAIIAEMAIAGFDTASIAGGIKDISGTLITVIMLVVAINALKVKKKPTGDFQAVFDDEMQTLIKKYKPMLIEKGEEESENYKGFFRYNIVNKLDCIVTNNTGGDNKLFRIKKGIDEIEFSVSATVFGKNKDAVSARIANKIQQIPSDMVSECKITPTGFALILKNPLESDIDAKNIVQIIDHILMLYIVEYKKS